MTIRKLLLLAAVVLTAVLTACILVYRMLTSGRVDPLVLLALAAALSIVIPMVRSNFFPSTRDCDAELDFHMRRQEAFVRQHLADNLGPESLAAIQAAMQTSVSEEGAALPDLVARITTQDNPELQFALSTTLARYYVQTGDPAAAIDSLTAALAHRPQDFVTRFNLAQNYAWLGDTERSLDAYRRLLDTPEDLSRAMRKLIRRRMAALESVRAG